MASDFGGVYAEIARRRLSNQLISALAAGGPGAVVERMGMLQAQDYLAALWAVGLRQHDAVEADIETALAEGRIIRTWPARGTLHFVSAEDVVWLLELLARRAIAHSQGRYRQLELDEATFSHSRDLFTRALQGGLRLTRSEMFQVLETAHIATAGQRGIHILGRLAQDGLICFGPRAGKQHTFVLLDEWAPQAKRLERDESLAELARRYFSSHGPAGLQDFVWWSGLSTADARRALELAGTDLLRESFGDQIFWRSEAAETVVEPSPTAHLLPAFDEYLIGYKDRQAVLKTAYGKQINLGGGMLNPAILIDGQVMGVWKRTLKKAAVIIEAHWFTRISPGQFDAFRNAALRYGEFLGLPVDLAGAQDG